MLIFPTFIFFINALKFIIEHMGDVIISEINMKQQCEKYIIELLTTNKFELKKIENGNDYILEKYNIIIKDYILNKFNIIC